MTGQGPFDFLGLEPADWVALAATEATATVGPVAEPVRVTPDMLRSEIAESLSGVKAYELSAACDRCGLAAVGGDEPDPWASKRIFVRNRALALNMPELIKVARHVVSEFGDDKLAATLARIGPQGTDGKLKNLIFAANGPKPRIVLRDAIENTIEIVENAEFCLVYDRPMEHGGLTWAGLVDWWRQAGGLGEEDERAVAKSLYRRLRASMTDSPPEITLFDAYCRLYGGEDGAAKPALIPQVYLHYDPYTARELGGAGTLPRQRMDFLLLMPDGARVVVEVDGKQHYANDDGSASTRRYADMVREDRSLRLAGYEVYRFGGLELVAQDAPALLDEFFEKLLSRHCPG